MTTKAVTRTTTPHQETDFTTSDHRSYDDGVPFRSLSTVSSTTIPNAANETSRHIHSVVHGSNQTAAEEIKKIPSIVKSDADVESKIVCDTEVECGERCPDKDAR